MLRWRIFVSVLLGLLCAGLVAGLDLFSPALYVQTEHRLRDFVSRSGRTAPINPDLLFLAIDSPSVTLDPQLDLDGLFSSTVATPGSRGALSIMSKGWPWDREVYSMILERLISAGARVVAFDCLFPASAQGDDSFHAALDRFKSQVVIGSSFVSPVGVDRSRRIPSTYEPPAATLIPNREMPDERVGFTNFLTAPDQIVRAAQFRIPFRAPGSSTATYFSFVARIAAEAGLTDRIPEGLSEHLIRFAGPTGTGFRPHSIFEIFVPEYWEHNYRSGEALRGKIVIVGAAGKWQTDQLLTPFGALPGAEVHLNVLNALSQGEFLRELPRWGNLFIILLASLFGTALCLTLRSPWLRLLGLTGVNFGAPFIALWFYNHPGVYLPCLAPLLALNSNVLLGIVSDFAFERMEKKRLRSTLKTRDDLTHMIVHDLRSPLTIVAGYVGALQDKAAAKLSPSEARFLSEAMRGANDMRDMITTLLDVGRLEAGEMPLRLEEQNVTEIARTAAQRFAPLLQQRTLHCHVPPDPVLAICDGDIVRRVLENLISNAIKYTKPDGTVTVAVQSNASDVTISVTDDGAGIPREEHKKIFQKFGQVNGGGEHRHSSGVGLAFCRMALEAHGGRIGIESEVGRGSTFHFSFPLRKEALTSALAPMSDTGKSLQKSKASVP